jgi:uncharacterized protein YbjQ (UPF0145 family)
MAKVTCRNCGETYQARPSWGERPPPPYCPQCLTKARVSAEATSPDRILLTTMEAVEGQRVTMVFGLVAGIGHPWAPVMGSTESRSSEALSDAQVDMRQRAKAMGANAVLGIKLAAYSGSGRVSQAVGVQLLGTAVTLEPLSGDLN